MTDLTRGLTGSVAVQAVLVSTVSEFKLLLCPDRMLELAKQTTLPDNEEYDGLGASLGIDLKVLKELQADWTTTFDWSAEQDSLNKSAIQPNFFWAQYLPDRD